MKAGWTLTELLVVIAVIGVLGGIAIPVVGGMRDTADQAKCVNNLRSLGVSIESYMSDNSNTFPNLDLGQKKAGDRQDVMEVVLADYVDNPEVFRCPADKEHFEKSGSSYYWNHHLSGMKRSTVIVFGMKSDEWRIPLVYDKEAFHGDENGTNFLFIDLSAGKELGFDFEVESK